MNALVITCLAAAAWQARWFFAGDTTTRTVRRAQTSLYWLAAAGVIAWILGSVPA